VSRFIVPVAACMFLLLSGSCDESFNPSAPFQRRMVVYSVLTTESDTQYVRVYASYNPPENDPSNNQDEQSLTDATVTVSSDSSVHEFQKIVLQRPDTSRYTSNIIAYVSYPFRLARGKTYKLTVASATLGTATAVTTVGGTAQISPVNFFFLADPYSVYSDTTGTADNLYGMDIYFSGQTEAFIARIDVDYLAPTAQGLRPKRRQIPIAVKAAGRNAWELIYPVARRIPLVYRATQAFSFWGWYDLLGKIIGVEDGYGSRFVQVVFRVIHIDMPLYNAYGIAHNFLDSNSVRLDEGDYTNISGGFGTFGSLAVDSTVRPFLNASSRSEKPDFHIGRAILRPGPSCSSAGREGADSSESLDGCANRFLHLGSHATTHSAHFWSSC